MAKRYIIHWKNIFLFLLTIAVICGAIYAVVGFFTREKSAPKDSEPEKATVVNASPEALRQSELMGGRLDSLMHKPMRLDTTKIAICVYDATTQRQVYSIHDKQLLPPASCLKIATAITAVKKLGLDHRYYESLLIRGDMKGDTLKGNLLLKADDDPLFESFDPLVKALRRHGIRVIKGNLYLSLAREDTLRPHATAKIWDLPFYKMPLLTKGRSYIRRNLVQVLHMNGITIKNDNTVKPTGKYRYIATSSHAMRDVLTPMMIHSSNIKAEATLYHLDYKTGLLPDHRMNWNIAHSTDRYLRQIFHDDTTHVMRGFVINDGSGLSPENRMTASFLVDMLKYAWDDKQLHDYFIKEALATPDNGQRRGSLLMRMQKPQFRGKVFCKTGTVVTIGASSLAGYVNASDGHWYIFSIINTDSPVAESRIFQDKVVGVMVK